MAFSSSPASMICCVAAIISGTSCRNCSWAKARRGCLLRGRFRQWSLGRSGRRRARRTHHALLGRGVLDQLADGPARGARRPWRSGARQRPRPARAPVAPSAGRVLEGVDAGDRAVGVLQRPDEELDKVVKVGLQHLVRVARDGAQQEHADLALARDSALAAPVGQLEQRRPPAGAELVLGDRGNERGHRVLHQRSEGRRQHARARAARVSGLPPPAGTSDAPSARGRAYLGSFTTACRKASLSCVLTVAARRRHDRMSRWRSRTAASCRTGHSGDWRRIWQSTTMMALLLKYSVSRSVACRVAQRGRADVALALGGSRDGRAVWAGARGTGASPAEWPRCWAGAAGA